MTTSKRFNRNGDFYDIYLRQVIYARYTDKNSEIHPTAYFATDVHNRGRYTYDTCIEAAAAVYPLECKAIEQGWGRAPPGYTTVCDGVLPCCYTPRLCTHCFCDWSDHSPTASGQKCVFAPGYMSHDRISAMDVYCPGWQDRWLGRE